MTVASGSALPLGSKALDPTSLVVLDSTNNTLQFATPGYYRIGFTAGVTIDQTGTTFDETTDFAAIGLRPVGTDNINIGASEWIYDEEAKQLTAQGLLLVNDASTVYEIVNVSNHDIYLKAPALANLATTSSYADPLVTVVIEYLGQS